MYLVLVVEQQLDRLDKFFVDCVQECVLHLDATVDEKLDHLQVLIVDRHQQAAAAKWIATIYVEIVAMLS